MTARKKDDPEANQDLPDEKQPPRGPGNNRGRSEDAPGHEDDDPTAEQLPAGGYPIISGEPDPSASGEDPNVYPDPDNITRNP